MNIKWPPEKTFEYEAHSKLLKEGKEAGVIIEAKDTVKRKDTRESEVR